MIEIGTKKLRVIKTASVAHDGKRVLKPKIENGEPVTKLVANEPVRITRERLNGEFGRDRNRRLVVKLADGDLLELRPEGTRQRVVMPLHAVYHWILRSLANHEKMARLREAKQRKAERLAERRLRRPLR